MMVKTNENIRHAYVSGDPDKVPFLLLHGTGGDEKDMLELGEFLGSDNPMLSIRGRVNENGLNRYFERFEDGTFNIDSLHEESEWLVGAIRDLALRYDFDPSEFVVVGYSNGANIAVQMLMHHPEISFRATVLLHPMLIEPTDNVVNLEDTKIFMTYGEFDPLVSQEAFANLKDTLRQGKPALSIFRYQASHAINQVEMQAAKLWLYGNGFVAAETEEHHHH